MEQNTDDTLATVEDVDALGETLTERLRNEGIETYSDFHDYRRRTADLWWDSVRGVGELTAERIEYDFEEAAHGELPDYKHRP
mgnify:CR=1 FL=1